MTQVPAHGPELSCMVPRAVQVMPLAATDMCDKLSLGFASEKSHIPTDSYEIIASE
jgi:hypothetical protein